MVRKSRVVLLVCAGCAAVATAVNYSRNKRVNKPKIFISPEKQRERYFLRSREVQTECEPSTQFEEFGVQCSLGDTGTKPRVGEQQIASTGRRSRSAQTVMIHTVDKCVQNSGPCVSFRLRGVAAHSVSEAGTQCKEKDLFSNEIQELRKCESVGNEERQVVIVHEKESEPQARASPMLRAGIDFFKRKEREAVEQKRRMMEMLAVRSEENRRLREELGLLRASVEEKCKDTDDDDDDLCNNMEKSFQKESSREMELIATVQELQQKIYLLEGDLKRKKNEQEKENRVVEDGSVKHTAKAVRIFGKLKEENGLLKKENERLRRQYNQN